MKLTQTRRGWLIEPETVSEKAHLRYLLAALEAQPPQGTPLSAREPQEQASLPCAEMLQPLRADDEQAGSGKQGVQTASPPSAGPVHGSSPYWFLRMVRGIVGLLLIVNIAGTINLHNYQYMDKTEAMAVFASSCVLVALLFLFFIGLKTLINFFHIRKHGCPHPRLTKWWNL
nr:hypothetical protein [uncultured Ottowia sp.]